MKTHTRDGAGRVCADGNCGERAVRTNAGQQASGAQSRSAMCQLSRHQRPQCRRSTLTGGQNAAVLVNKMKDYKDGKQQATIMHQLARATAMSKLL